MACLNHPQDLTGRLSRWKLKALIPREGVAKSGLNFQPSLHPQHLSTPNPLPKRLGRRVKRRLRVQTKTKVVAKDPTWVVVLVQPFVRAKYALYYLCAKEIVNIRDCVFWIRLKHRMIVRHCRVRRSFYRFTKNKAQPTRLSHNSFNKETGFSWKIRREWPESSLPSCQACRLTASLSKGFVVSKASLVIL